jgi:hypothetical protein
MSKEYTSEEVTKLLSDTHIIQDITAMLQSCLLSEDDPEHLTDWAMTLCKLTELMLPPITEFFDWHCVELRAKEYNKERGRK